MGYMGDFNTPLSLMGRLSKTNIQTLEMNDTINHMDLTNISTEYFTETVKNTYYSQKHMEIIPKLIIY